MKATQRTWLYSAKISLVPLHVYGRYGEQVSFENILLHIANDLNKKVNR